jgi:hypothetical protein
VPDSAPPERPDPYAVRRPGAGQGVGETHGEHDPPRTERPRRAEQPHTPPRPPGPDAVRNTRTLGLVAVIAAVMAIAIPPAGIVLGIATLVVAARNRSSAGGPQLSRQAMALSVSGGVFALVVGGLLSLLSLLLGAETGQLRECLAGANTRVAEQACQSEFMDAVQRRLTGD